MAAAAVCAERSVCSNSEVRVKVAVALCLLAACGTATAGQAQTEQAAFVLAPDVLAGGFRTQDFLANAGQADPQADRPGAAPVDPFGQGIRLPRDYQIAYPTEIKDGQGSTYIPMDSWIYPALDRLHGLGYLDTAFLGLRPWTRLSVFHMLDRGQAPPSGESDAQDEARTLYDAVLAEVGPDLYFTGEHAELDTVYTRFLDLVKTPLNDSFHLGQTIINDYGRPYQKGLQNVTGASGRVEAGRATLYIRGEMQHAAAGAGYSPELGTYLDNEVDNIHYIYGLQAPITAFGVTYTPAPTQQATDPVGPIAGVTHFRLLEANIGYHLLKHELTLGKTDHWLGPGKGGAFAWSTNADSIYSFQIDRVEPFYVPLLRRAVGPLRYNFFVGTLGGHTQPNHPWVHSEKVSIHPTKNLEVGFQRTVIWGGRGHEPVTLHTFLRSFVSVNNTNDSTKFSIYDPGARFSAFDFNYRLPYLRNWLMLYLDSFSHDDVSPASAPRRAAIRPGLYLSHFPGVPRLDLRVEAASTDCVTSRCNGQVVTGTQSGPGQFYYYEAVEQQGTTNKGFLYTDPIGRDNKGGQAWLTYNLSPQEHLQFAYRNVKADKNFIPGSVPSATIPSLDAISAPFTRGGGTTQNAGTVDLLKRITPELGVHLAVQVERWKAPVYMIGRHSDAAVWAEVIWYPHKEKDLGNDPKF